MLRADRNASIVRAETTMALAYAILTVACWGTWLTPSQNVKFSGQQVRAFYVTVANLAIAATIAFSLGLDTLTPASFWLPFGGGVVWSLGGWMAFAAADQIGLVRAYGMWSPLNIVVSFLVGALWFDEFVMLNGRTLALLSVSFVLIIGGVLIIILSQGKDRGKGTEMVNRRALVRGIACAVAAGVFWAAYYIPIRIANISMWVAALPMACGMYFGCMLLAVLARKPLRLENAQAYVRTGASGMLWAGGNYGMLMLVQALGSARGFTIAQLAVVVNALCGIYLLRDPEPKSRAARFALTGCVIATIGAITLGRLR
jgi:glucose uptake protein